MLRQLGHGKDGHPVGRRIARSFVEREPGEAILDAIGHEPTVFARLGQHRSPERLGNARAEKLSADDDGRIAGQRMDEQQGAYRQVEFADGAGHQLIGFALPCRRESQ